MPTGESRDRNPGRRSTRTSTSGEPKAAKGAPVQQAFLDELIRNRTRVSIFLVNGVKLEGEIRSYDRYVILMKNAVTDKVYKHAVSTIMPMTSQSTAAGTLADKRQPRVRRGAVTSSARG